MSNEPALESIEAQGQPVSLPFSSNGLVRALLGLFVIVMPVIAFLGIQLDPPTWQNGRLNSYINLLLFPESSLWFFPLLAYSIFCYWLLLFAPMRFARFFIVRLGVYTGALLALQYSVLVMLYSPVVIPIWIFLYIFLRAYRWALARWTTFSVNMFVLVFGLIIVISGYFLSERIILVLIYSPSYILFLFFMAAPFWMLLVALRPVIWLFKNHETRFTILRGLGITAWIATYAFAWRYDILKMFELYQALPTKPPEDCYIATAAAQGHPRIVGSHLVHRADGLSMRVNGQLQHLKCAELALMVVSPRMHGVLRKIYDVVGRSLAQRMTNPFLADVAYLLLKPAEWFAIIVLKWIVPEIEALSRRMYIGQ